MFSASQISPIKFPWGMVGAGTVDLVILSLIICTIFVILESRFRALGKEEEWHERLDHLEGSINIVAEVLQRIPDILPKYEINQNPLAQILEFWQNLRAEQEYSIGDNQLRDPSGRFSDGPEEEKKL